MERRVFERFSARFPVKYHHSREDYGMNVFLRDASAQGVKIATRDRVFKNDNVSLLVKLPDGAAPLLLNGKVVWIQEKNPELWDVGLEFHKTNLMQMQRIFKHVSSPSYIF